MFKKRRDNFTPEHPPRSGNVKRLWDWWIRHMGHAPEEIHVARPGINQRNAGAAHYIIRDENTEYLVYEVDYALQGTPADAIPGWPGTGDYMLGWTKLQGHQH